MRICWTPAAASDYGTLAITSRSTIRITGSRLCASCMSLSSPSKSGYIVAVPDVRKGRESFCSLPFPILLFIARKIRTSKSCGSITALGTGARGWAIRGDHIGGSPDHMISAPSPTPASPPAGLC